VPVAGGMKNDGSSGQPDSWTVYLASDDAEKTVAASEAAGGQTIVPAMAVPGVGTMAVVADPGDAAIGIWQPEEHKGFGVLAEPGAPAWFELHTRDYDRVLEYYRATFGWDTHTQGDSEEFRYTTLGEGDAQAAGVMDASIFPDDAPLGWTVYFGVADADATAAEIEQLGGSIRIPVEDTPYGRLAEAVDPTGARFKIQQP
jgi:predicted enzyme related to lactoylglutathione lyase